MLCNFMAPFIQKDMENGWFFLSNVQKQPSRGALKIYSKFTGKQLYWNHTSAWVFSCKFAAYFQNTFSWENLWEHLWVAASECWTLRRIGFLNHFSISEKLHWAENTVFLKSSPLSRQKITRSSSRREMSLKKGLLKVPLNLQENTRDSLFLK